MEKHKIASTFGLNLYLGTDLDESTLVRQEDYDLKLSDTLKTGGGSLNDHVLQVVTYDYANHKTAEVPGAPRNYGILRLPREVSLQPLRQWGAG